MSSAMVESTEELKNVRKQIAEYEDNLKRSGLPEKEKEYLQQTVLKLRDKVVVLIVQQTAAINAAGAGASATGATWTGHKSFIYSEHLAKLGMAKPYEQYGLYGSILWGLGYATRSFWRAHMVMKSSHEPDPVKARELRLFAAATAEQVEFAALYAGRFRVRGVLYGLGAPLMWTVFTLGRHAPMPSSKS